jgi:hypothetical protein
MSEIGDFISGHRDSVKDDDDDLKRCGAARKTRHDRASNQLSDRPVSECVVICPCTSQQQQHERMKLPWRVARA